MLTTFAGAFVGLILVCVGLAVVAFRYAMAARSGNVMPPVIINPGAALKAIQDALEGNSAAALTALGESFHLDVVNGSVEEKLLIAGFKELRRRAADPNAKMPAIDYIAHFSGKSREQVIAFLEAEADVSTAPAAPAVPAAAAIAALLLAFCLAAPASAASPLRLPDRWEPSETKIVLDSPVFYSPIYESQRQEILLPNNAYKPVACYGQPCPCAYYATEYQQSYYQNGRWYPGKLVGRAAGSAARFVGRVVSAPFRWLFRRGRC